MPRVDVASRVLDAPILRVYQALIDPVALEAWLPPAGMIGRFEHFDLRPGGSYRLVLTYLDDAVGSGKTTANADVVEARFVELESGKRVVQAVQFVSADPAFAGTMTMTWEVTAVGIGTLVTIAASGVPEGISEHDHAVGLASSLANLATHLGQ